MKSFAAKFNKTTFGADTTGFEYVRLADRYSRDGDGVVYNINGLYVRKSPLGDSPVIIDTAARQLVNVPKHMSAVFCDILADDEAVAAIKNGKVGFTIRPYESHNRKCFTINFVDM